MENSARKQHRFDHLPSGTGGGHLIEFALKAASMYIWDRDLNSTHVDRIGDPIDVLGSAVDSIDDFVRQVHHEDRDRVRTSIEHVLKYSEPYDLEFRFLKPSGETVWVRDVGRRIETPFGERFVGICSDVTKEVEARRAVTHLALHDNLTGLPNRTLLRQRLDDEVAKLRDSEHQVAVLSLDLNGFKSINDTLGHGAGDTVLKRLGSMLVEICQEADTVSRTGGDEFVILIPSASVAQVVSITESICKALQTPFLVDGQKVFVGTSIGVAIGPDDGSETEALLHCSDLALCEAKSGRHDGAWFYKPGMDLKIRRRRRVESDLRVALVRNEIKLVYQPMFNLIDGSTVGVEALMRWEHPELGAISPEEFIPLAEATGLIFQLGEWALRTACSEAVAWPDIGLSVNVSPVQFRHKNFVATLINIIGSTGIDPQQLELEITENVLLHDPEETQQTFRKLKEIGVSIAMDDFGTGYSSLSYISRFAFDKIKIDGSFVRELGKTRESEAIIRAVLNLGRNLGIKITAESVETVEQLKFLTDVGCDQVQGYFFSPAVGTADIRDRLRQELRRPT